jgi:hypothetical protein
MFPRAKLLNANMPAILRAFSKHSAPLGLTADENGQVAQAGVVSFSRSDRFIAQ